MRGLGHVLPATPAPTDVLPGEAFPPVPDPGEFVDGVPAELLEQRSPQPMPVAFLEPPTVRIASAKTFTTMQMAVADTAASGTGIRILGTAFTRKDALIRNVGATTVYVAGEQSAATPTTGFPLNAGDSIVIETVHEIWACPAAGTVGQIAVMQQYRDGG